MFRTRLPLPVVHHCWDIQYLSQDVSNSFVQKKSFTTFERYAQSDASGCLILNCCVNCRPLSGNSPVTIPHESMAISHTQIKQYFSSWVFVWQLKSCSVSIMRPPVAGKDHIALFAGANNLEVSRNIAQAIILSKPASPLSRGSKQGTAARKSE